MCRGRKIDETLQKYIFRLKALILRVSFYGRFFFSQFQMIVFNPIITVVLVFLFFSFLFFSFLFFSSLFFSSLFFSSLFFSFLSNSQFLSSCSYIGKQNFLWLREILVMLVDITASPEAGKQENLFRGQKDLCQFFLSWGKILHPEMRPSTPSGGPEPTIDISRRSCS